MGCKGFPLWGKSVLGPRLGKRTQPSLVGGRGYL